MISWSPRRARSAPQPFYLFLPFPARPASTTRRCPAPGAARRSSRSFGRATRREGASDDAHYRLHLRGRRAEPVANAVAQEVAAPPTVSLNAHNFASGVIEPSQRAATRALTIDKGRATTIVVETTEAVSGTIGLPDVSRVDAEKAPHDRVSWQSFEGRGGAASWALPGFGSRFNTLITVATPQSGRNALNLARKNDCG